MPRAGEVIGGPNYNSREYLADIDSLLPLWSKEEGEEPGEQVQRTYLNNAKRSLLCSAFCSPKPPISAKTERRLCSAFPPPESTLETVPEPPPPRLCSAFRTSPLVLFLPQGLSEAVRFLVSEAEHSRWQSEKMRHKLLAVVHLILERRLMLDKAPAAYVPLSATLLQRCLGPRHYAQAVRLLEREGFIESRRNDTGGKSYCAGRFCASYRLVENWQTVPVTAEPFANRTLAATLKRLRKEASEEAEASVGVDAVHRFLWTGMQGVKLTPEAWTQIESEQLTPRQLWTWLTTCRAVEEGSLWFSVSENTGRISHTLANAPRKLRPFLRCQRERIVEVDIANAQPAFCLGFYPESHPERKRFASVVTAGRFYEKLVSAVEAVRPDRALYWTKKYKSDRDGTKEAIFKSCFYGSAPTAPSALREALAHLFPWLAAELLRLRKKGKSVTALKLQSTEARFMFGRVVPRIMRELPGVAVLSLHDGLLVPESSAEAVRKIVEDETETAFGVRLTVRRK